MAGGRPPRNLADRLPELHGLAHARPADHGSARQPARVHQVVLGLSRHPGDTTNASSKAARCSRNTAATFDAVERAYGVDRYIDRRDLGRRDQLRHAGRRTSGRSLNRYARLHWPAAELFSRGISLRAGNPAARRRAARPPGRLLGGRVRPDAIHADGVQALRRRFRPRRPPRRGRTRFPTHRLHRQQSEERRLAHRPDLGLRGRGAGDVQFPARRSRASTMSIRDWDRATASRAPTANRFRGRTIAHFCWCRPACRGPAS